MTTDVEFGWLAEEAVHELTMEPERLRVMPAIVSDVEQALRTRWPDCTVKPFGSVINGTSSRTSDLDLTVVFEDGAEGTGVSEEDARLANLAAITLRQYPHIFTHVHVPDKYFKIATCIHAPTGLPIDVSFRRVMNVQNTAMVRYFMNLDKRAFQLTILIKRWAALRGVIVSHSDQTTSPAFTNYNIILLVIFYLQQRRVVPPVAELQRGAPPLYIDGWNAAFEHREFDTNNTESLLALLGGFFAYYEGFDYGRYAIAVFAGYPVERRVLRPGSELQLPPELAAYSDHKPAPIHTSPSFLMLECFDYNQLSGTKLNLEEFKIAAEAYRRLKSTDFLKFLLTDKMLADFKTIR